MFKKSSLCGAILIGSLAAGCVMSAAAAEDATIPNFASIEPGWLLQGGIDFRPIPGKIAPITFDPAYPQRPGNQLGAMERMSDAENPNLKPWAQELMRKYNQDVLHGHRAFSSQSRCWPGGTPGQLLFPAEPIFFVQTPKEVWISGSASKRCAVFTWTYRIRLIRNLPGSGNRSAITKMASWSWTPSAFSTNMNSIS
jgi:hypothetical protein